MTSNLSTNAWHTPSPQWNSPNAPSSERQARWVDR